jgi:hypothetical protein
MPWSRRGALAATPQARLTAIVDALTTLAIRSAPDMTPAAVCRATPHRPRSRATGASSSRCGPSLQAARGLVGRRAETADKTMPLRLSRETATFAGGERVDRPIPDRFARSGAPAVPSFTRREMNSSRAGAPLRSDSGAARALNDPVALELGSCHRTPSTPCGRPMARRDGASPRRLDANASHRSVERAGPTRADVGAPHEPASPNAHD